MVTQLFSGILYGCRESILVALGTLLQNCLRTHNADECQLVLCKSGAELNHALASQERWDIACVDIGNGDDMVSVHRIRQRCPRAELLLVVDKSVSPMVYIRPGVLPSQLFQYPADADSMKELMDEFVCHFLATRITSEETKRFLIETKSGVISVPLTSILFFESRAKRICVRLNRREYMFYDTLERIQQVLPDSFVRCHRSFIVNIAHVKRLALGDNQVEMKGGLFIPVSRTYKASVREHMR